MPTSFPELFNSLAAKLSGEKTRQQAGRTLTYVTARTVMNRLDEVLGPENWWDEYITIANGVLCRLSIRLPDGQVVTKEDAGGCAGLADQGDDEKSGFSDAFKRVAVKFGVGRYLYQDGVARLTSSAAVTTPAAQPAATAIAATTKPVHRPKTAIELLDYAARCTADPDLARWISQRFKDGYSADITRWTPAQVMKAWPLIREHLIDCAQARKLAAAS